MPPERALETALAASVATTIKAVVTPLVARIGALEGQLAAFLGLLAELGELRKDAAGLRERVAVVEVKAMQPGPPGPPGKDGLDGKDGLPGLHYDDIYTEGKTYQRGAVVTWAGSAWHCHAATTTAKPGEGATDWRLMVKRGRDGKDVR
jgi:hypothetical protein